MRALLLSCGMLAFNLVGTVVWAELYECNGVWTNRPCEGQSSNSMKESAAKQIDVAEREAKEKRFWVNDLELKRLRARKEHGLEMNVGDVMELCQDSSTTLQVCRNAVAARENEIGKSILDAKNAALKQQTLEEEKRKTEADIVNQINVFDNRTLVVKGRHPNKPRPQPREDLRPNYTPINPQPSKGGSRVRFHRETGGLE